MVVVDHCDYNLALEHGDKLGAAWRCANRTREPAAELGAECSNIFNTCHTLLDLTGPLQLGALPGRTPFLNSCVILRFTHLHKTFFPILKSKSLDIFLSAA